MEPFGEREAESELLVVAGRPHGHRDRPAADPDLERLLDGDDVAGDAARNPHATSTFVVAYGEAPDCREYLLLGWRSWRSAQAREEHALAWRLARSPSLGELHAAPGNPGIARLGACHPVRADDGEGLLDVSASWRWTRISS